MTYSDTVLPGQSGSAPDPGHAPSQDAVEDVKSALLAGRVLTVDGSGAVSDWNSRAESAFGWTRGEMMGRPFLDTLLPEASDDERAQLEQVLGVRSGDVRGSRALTGVRHRDGRIIPAALAAVPVPLDLAPAFSALHHDLARSSGDEEDVRRLGMVHSRVLRAVGNALAPDARDADDDSAHDARLAGAIVVFSPQTGETAHPADKDQAAAPVEARALPAIRREEPVARATVVPISPGNTAGPAPRSMDPPAARMVPAAAPAVDDSRVRRALDDELLVLCAQPVRDLRTEQVAQHELLLRLTGEDGRLILPQAFLPVAERCEVMRPIDRWVARRAIGLIADQQRLGRDVRLEVNLSAAALTDPELPSLVEQELTAAGVEPSRLVFEVGELIAVRHIDAAGRLSKRLRSMGCRFALDNVGASFASLRHLKALSLDHVKIDGSLVATVVESRTDRLVLKALVDIARGLGASTIAEWVTDEETLPVLRAHGVDFAQGYRIGPPRPVGDVWPAERSPED